MTLVIASIADLTSCQVTTHPGHAAAKHRMSACGGPPPWPYGVDVGDLPNGLDPLASFMEET